MHARRRQTKSLLQAVLVRHVFDARPPPTLSVSSAGVAGVPVSGVSKTRPQVACVGSDLSDSRTKSCPYMYMRADIPTGMPTLFCEHICCPTTQAAKTRT